MRKDKSLLCQGQFGIVETLPEEAKDMGSRLSSPILAV